MANPSYAVLLPERCTLKILNGVALRTALNFRPRFAKILELPTGVSLPPRRNEVQMVFEHIEKLKQELKGLP